MKAPKSNWSNFINRHFKKWRLSSKRQAPYNHIVQIGDPVLRQKSEKVSSSMLKSDLVEETIYTLKRVIDKYDAVGVSAPQIG